MKKLFLIFSPCFAFFSMSTIFLSNFWHSSGAFFRRKRSIYSLAHLQYSPRTSKYILGPRIRLESNNVGIQKIRGSNKRIRDRAPFSINQENIQKERKSLILSKSKTQKEKITPLNRRQLKIKLGGESIVSASTCRLTSFS